MCRCSATCLVCPFTGLLNALHHLLVKLCCLQFHTGHVACYKPEPAVIGWPRSNMRWHCFLSLLAVSVQITKTRAESVKYGVDSVQFTSVYQSVYITVSCLIQCLAKKNFA